MAGYQSGVGGLSSVALMDRLRERAGTLIFLLWILTASLGLHLSHRREQTLYSRTSSGSSSRSQERPWRTDGPSIIANAAFQFVRSGDPSTLGISLISPCKMMESKSSASWYGSMFTFDHGRIQQKDNCGFAADVRLSVFGPLCPVRWPTRS